MDNIPTKEAAPPKEQVLQIVYIFLIITQYLIENED